MQVNLQRELMRPLNDVTQIRKTTKAQDLLKIFTFNDNPLEIYSTITLFFATKYATCESQLKFG